MVLLSAEERDVTEGIGESQERWAPVPALPPPPG